MNGWILLHKKVWESDHFVVKNRSVMLLAWVWLLTHCDGDGIVTVGRKKLADELGVTEDEARGALKNISQRMTHEVTSEVTNRFTKFRILNWASYQRKVPNQVPAKSPPSPHTIKNKNKEEYNTDFNEFYAAYPNKKAPKVAYKAWCNAKDKPKLPELLKAIEQQKRSRQWKEGFVPYPATWLNAGRWADQEDQQQQTNGRVYD